MYERAPAFFRSSKGGASFGLLALLALAIQSALERPARGESGAPSAAASQHAPTPTPARPAPVGPDEHSRPGRAGAAPGANPAPATGGRPPAAHLPSAATPLANAAPAPSTAPAPSAPAASAPALANAAVESATAAGAAGGPSPAQLTIERALTLADRNHPNIAAARERLNKMRAQLDEAHWTPYTQLTATAGVGLAPTVRGTSLYSPNTDVSLTSNMGIAWRTSVDGVIPLWTFGKITNLWDAAEAQIKVGESAVQKERNQVKMDVRRAFYGLQLARDSVALLDEAAGQLDKAIGKLEEQIKSGEGDEIDLLKLRTFRYEVDGRRSEARRYEAIAVAALHFLTGVDGPLDIWPARLEVNQRPLAPVAYYLGAARLHRPDINMARAGVLARQAQVELARSKYYPDIGIALSASWARAPEVEDQLNPFVRDDANFFHYGAALALRWPLDFPANAARVAQAQADLEEMRQTERYALGGAGVEVETAYAQVVDAQAREKAYGGAERTAKQWVIAIQQGIDVGTSEESDLVDAARQWALQRFNHLNAMMDLDLAWASLALATGYDRLAAPE